MHTRNHSRLFFDVTSKFSNYSFSILRLINEPLIQIFFAQNPKKMKSNWCGLKESMQKLSYQEKTYPGENKSTSEADPAIWKRRCEGSNRRIAIRVNLVFVKKQQLLNVYRACSLQIFCNGMPPPHPLPCHKHPSLI